MFGPSYKDVPVIQRCARHTKMCQSYKDVSGPFIHRRFCAMHTKMFCAIRTKMFLCSSYRDVFAVIHAKILYANHTKAFVCRHTEMFLFPSYKDEFVLFIQKCFVPFIHRYFFQTG